MKCNNMYKSLCELYVDHYDDCNSHACLVDLLGEDEMLRKCANCGLDKEYPDEYKAIVERRQNG